MLVNNAGILVAADFATVTMEEVDRSMQVLCILAPHLSLFLSSIFSFSHPSPLFCLTLSSYSPPLYPPCPR